MIYVCTSILNGFDNLRPPMPEVRPDPGVRYVCFTNIPQAASVSPWEFRPIYPATGNAGRDSRIPKILPHLMLPADAEFSIWHDGNFQLKIDPATIVKELLASHDWAAHKHPGRNCVYGEGRVLIKESIGTRSLVERDIATFQSLGFPENGGLWANGMIVRRHTGAVAELNQLWWKMFLEGCERDQLSFPVARWLSKFEIKTIGADIWNSPYMQFSWHAAWISANDNPAFFEERFQIRKRLADLARLTGSDAGVKYHEY